ncbi:HSP20-like chaperone, partial [Bombardia bombarda]
PRFDVHETKTGYELHGELPGVERENLRIEFTDDDALVISGHVGPAASPLNEKKTPAAPAAAAAAAAAAAPRQWQTERSLGEFSRRFLFAQKVDRDAISAGLHNGVLVVSVPKAKRFQPRRIVV